MIGYFAYAVATQAVTFLITFLLIMKKMPTVVCFMIPMLIALGCFLFAKYSNMVSKPAAEPTSITPSADISGEAKKEYYTLLGLYIAYAIIIGNSLQIYKGFGFLENVGFTSLLGSLSGAMLSYQMV